MRVVVRRQKGSMMALAFVGLVPLLAAIGGFAVDCMHVNDERGALQRATDAGALAGAIDIPGWRGTLQDWGNINSGTDFSKPNTGTNEEPVDMALATTGLNVVDGRLPYHNGTTINVLAEMLTDTKESSPPSTHANPPDLASGGSPPAYCHVNASMKINSIFAGFFGNWTQTVTADSIAGGGQPLDTLYKYMPILVSSTQADTMGNLLSGRSVGTPFTVTIKSNSVWIFNPDPTDASALQSYANGTPMTPPEPPITIDTTINSDNGVKSAGSNFSLFQPGQVVIFPVTSDPVGSGPPSHKVIGFFALSITSVNPTNPNPSITGNVVAAIGNGTNTGVASDPLFSTYALGKVTAVHLVQ